MYNYRKKASVSLFTSFRNKPTAAPTLKGRSLEFTADVSVSISHLIHLTLTGGRLLFIPMKQNENNRTKTWLTKLVKSARNNLQNSTITWNTLLELSGFNHNHKLLVMNNDLFYEP